MSQTIASSKDTFKNVYRNATCVLSKEVLTKFRESTASYILDNQEPFWDSIENKEKIFDKEFLDCFDDNFAGSKGLDLHFGSMRTPVNPERIISRPYKESSSPEIDDELKDIPTLDPDFFSEVSRSMIAEDNPNIGYFETEEEIAEAIKSSTKKYNKVFVSPVNEGSELIKSIDHERKQRLENSRTDDYTPKYWWDNWWEHVYKTDYSIDTVKIPKEMTSQEAKTMLKEIDKLEKEVPSKLPKELVSDNFPSSNIYLNSNGNMIIECALAGYDPKKISVTIESNYLIIKEHREVKSGTPPAISYLQHGIKRPIIFCKYFVDEDIFNLSNVDVKSRHGLLVITFIRKDYIPPQGDLQIVVEE